MRRKESSRVANPEGWRRAFELTVIGAMVAILGAGIFLFLQHVMAGVATSALAAVLGGQ